MPARQKNLVWIPVVLFIIVLVLSVISAMDYFYFRNRIYQGVYLSDLDLSKLTTQQALLELEKKLTSADFQKNQIQFDYQKQKITKTFGELGIAADISQIVRDAMSVGREGLHIFRYPQRWRLYRHHYLVMPSVMIHEEQFAAGLYDIRKAVEKAPVNARLTLSPDKKTVAITKDIPGSRLDLPATREQVRKALQSNFLPVETELVVTPVDAEVTAAYLESLEIRELLSTCSTVISSAIPNRVHNIALAAAALDNQLIMPGEEFSFNTLVGDSTEEKGYKPAPVIVSGKLADGMGGGVCQVSSTLYNTVLLANLQVLERRNHSLYVNYLPPGLDATVAYGSIDFRFVNTHPYPLWLRTFTEGTSLVISLYSTRIRGQEVSLVTTDVITIAPGEKLTETDTMPAGTRKLISEGKSGYKATVWRVTMINGEEMREKISRDTYKPVPAEYLVGTGESVAQNIVQKEEE